MIIAPIGMQQLGTATLSQLFIVRQWCAYLNASLGLGMAVIVMNRALRKASKMFRSAY